MLCLCFSYMVRIWTSWTKIRFPANGKSALGNYYNYILKLLCRNPNVIFPRCKTVDSTCPTCRDGSVSKRLAMTHLMAGGSVPGAGVKGDNPPIVAETVTKHFHDHCCNRTANRGRPLFGGGGVISIRQFRVGRGLIFIDTSLGGNDPLVVWTHFGIERIK